jgi:hypothetical protein
MLVHTSSHTPASFVSLFHIIHPPLTNATHARSRSTIRVPLLSCLLYSCPSFLPLTKLSIVFVFDEAATGKNEYRNAQKKNKTQSPCVSALSQLLRCKLFFWSKV